MVATKVDLKRERAELYRAGFEPALVEVPELAYLMVAGSGDPNRSPEFAEAIEALFGVAYALKFALRRGTGIDYTVMPLEALWWSEGALDLAGADRSSWRWTAMIAEPAELTAGLVHETIAATRAKKGLPALERMRFERLLEGTAAQLIHLGPYSTEGPSIVRLRDFIAASGLRPRGAHHEIYLADPRRAAPEKLKTVIRQPVEPT